MDLKQEQKRELKQEQKIERRQDHKREIKRDLEDALTVTAKHFSQLTTLELYEILRARAAVFVVEQNCVYQDVDNKDLESIHICLRKEGRLVAYMRGFLRAGSLVQVGRVLTLERGAGYGAILFAEGLSILKEVYHPEGFFLEAQVYAKGFYERFGFQVCSEEFLEDGIPHVQMGVSCPEKM